MSTEKNAESQTHRQARVADDAQRPAAKLSYSSPVLTEYGSVATLTQKSKGSGADSKSQES